MYLSLEGGEKCLTLWMNKEAVQKIGFELKGPDLQTLQ